MLYCEKAIINCYNYGGAITLDIAISRKGKERDDSRKEKIQEFMMKFPRRVCEHRKANEWKGSSEIQESQALMSQVSGVDSCSCMAMKDSKPACFTNCLT